MVRGKTSVLHQIISITVQYTREIGREGDKGDMEEGREGLL